MKGVGRDKAAIGARANHDVVPGPQEYLLPTTITVQVCYLVQYTVNRCVFMLIVTQKDS